MWTNGPLDPAVAAETERALDGQGIAAEVVARQYGETDSCGSFSLSGIDYDVRLKGGDPVTGSRGPATQIAPILAQYGKPRVGNMRVTDAFGNTVLLPHESATLPVQPRAQSSRSSTTTGDHSLFFPMVAQSSLSTMPITRKVYVIAYDPLLSNGQNLSTYLKWYSRDTLSQQTIDFFKSVTNNRVQYSIVATTVITDEWPAKMDGFRYDETSYLDVIQGRATPHSPDNVDYSAIVNSDRLDICGKANRGEIDEVWMYNGPFFGFYESTLAGPGAFWFNSPPVPETNSCNRLIPIMGPSPQREVDCAIENFGHRTESTLDKVYGWREANETSNSWEKYALVKALAPSYTYSGCGTVHYPPNGITDYDYADSAAVLTNCADFYNYPNLNDPVTVAMAATCSDWSCSQLNYFRYWFEHLPRAPGCGSDYFSSDWWVYFASPVRALDPGMGCQ